MSYTSAALDSQLLCACGVSYQIGTSTPLNTEPYYSGAGFTTTNVPTVHHGRLPHTSACIIGQVSGNIVIAFRGTEATQINDWSTDLMGGPVATKEFPGKVHSGFYLSLMEIMPQILKTLEGLLAQNAQTPIVITGHSKGGGMASPAAWYLNKNLSNPPTITVTTFASPMPGDKTFSDAYRGVGGIIPHEIFYQKNYVNYLDLVPYLPPSKKIATDLVSWASGLDAPFNTIVGDLMGSFAKWDYTQVAAQTEYILETGQISDGSGNYITFMAALKSYIESGDPTDYEAIMAAHSHLCGGGYMTAICPSVKCTVV